MADYLDKNLILKIDAIICLYKNIKFRKAISYS